MVSTVPYIPETITVHLGRPQDYAQNVTVNFRDYIKNVASSEIYPTWPEAAIRANIYAQLSYTLNRIYTEWYRSQGYDFDITNSTQFDHSFVPNRDIFDNISRIVDDIFDSYIRQKGQVEPYISPYCDGVRTMCDGLRQWGTVDLANSGMNSFEILQYYYGDNIELVQDVDVQSIEPSYPGVPLRYGNIGNDVRIIQTQLNRIAGNYPSIPKINPVTGDFGRTTENAVREFQRIFNMPVDGIVGKATWYQISYIYSVVKKLAEIESEGIKYGFETQQFPEELGPGMTTQGVSLLQYFLSVIGQFDNNMPSLSITGTYDEATTNSVRVFQNLQGLPVTGVIDRATWDRIYDVYRGIIDSIPGAIGALPIVLYGGVVLRQGASGDSVKTMQDYLNFIADYYPAIPKVDPIGVFGPQTRNSVVAFQQALGLPADGVVGEQTWNSILDVYQSILRRSNPNIPQFPGYSLIEGLRDL